MNVKWLLWVKETVSKGYLLYASFIQHSGKGQTVEIENSSVVSRGWGHKVGWTAEERGEIWGAMEPLCVLVVVGATQLYAFVKTRRTAY